MSRPHPIKARLGDKPGELVVSMPPGWELRLRRIIRELTNEPLPDPREKGISERQRQSRLRLRQERMRQAVCQYLADLLAADIVGKEVALSTRDFYGRRTGSLREHVASILREVADDPTAGQERGGREATGRGGPSGVSRRRSLDDGA